MIRKLFPTLIIIFFVTNISYSQLFKVGFSGALSSSTFGGVSPENSSYESLTGYGGSLIGEVRITNNVYLSFQPGYLAKGSKIKFGNENSLINDTTATFTIKQNYFSLPLNVKFFNRRFYVSAGASVQFLSSAKLTSDTSSGEKDIKDKFKTYDVVSNFSVGYQLPIGKPYLFFELSYLQGLININNTNNISSQEIYIANFKSKGFSFITGLIYPLK